MLEEIKLNSNVMQQEGEALFIFEVNVLVRSFWLQVKETRFT